MFNVCAGVKTGAGDVRMPCEVDQVDQHDKQPPDLRCERAAPCAAKLRGGGLHKYEMSRRTPI